VKRQVQSVNGGCNRGIRCDNLSNMMRKAIKRYAVVLAAWLPYFAIWVFCAMLYGRYPLRASLIEMISLGSASLAGNRCLARSLT
jgi:hypothetical protein